MRDGFRTIGLKHLADTAARHGEFNYSFLPSAAKYFFDQNEAFRRQHSE